MRENATAVFILALLLIHAVALGGVFLRLSRWVIHDGWTFTAVLLGEGLALFGGELFVLGEVRALNRAVIYLSTAVMLGLIAWSRPWQSLKGLPDEAVPNAPGRIRRAIMWASFGAVFFAVLMICSHPMVPWEDEFQYHWPTALLWASNHGWVNSPYRLTNGPALAEMMYTVPALYGSLTAARLLSITFLLLIAASCASLARAVGALPLPAALVMLSAPVVLFYAPKAHNDNLAAGFTLCAYAALLNASTEAPNGSAIIAAALAMAAAVSTKPFTGLAAPGICAYILYFGIRRGADRPARTRAIARSSSVVAALVLTILIWSAHCYGHSGQLWDTRGYTIAQSPTDPLWDSPLAAGRKPRLVDYVLTPLTFPLKKIVGATDGFAGYPIGPLLAAFFPLGLITIRDMRSDQRTTLYFLIGSAAFYLVILSPTAPKTRFHLFVWGVGSVVAASGFTSMQRRRPWIAYTGFAAFMSLFTYSALTGWPFIHSFGFHLTDRLRASGF